VATSVKPWPPHGHAVDARNWSAIKAQRIRAEADLLLKLRHTNQLTVDELMYRLHQISALSSDILRLLEAQGAPTVPRPEE